MHPIFFFFIERYPSLSISLIQCKLRQSWLKSIFIFQKNIYSDKASADTLAVLSVFYSWCNVWWRMGNIKLSLKCRKNPLQFIALFLRLLSFLYCLVHYIYYSCVHYSNAPSVSLFQSPLEKLTVKWTYNW